MVGMRMERSGFMDRMEKEIARTGRGNAVTVDPGIRTPTEDGAGR
jgi:hypothetical protein